MEAVLESQSQIDKIVGERIELIRDSRGLSQASFAKALMVDQPVVSRLEQGDRSIKPHEIVAVCECFGVAPGWLLGLSDNP
jgi:transcriptional regulator with XRE-family HTH domain